MGTDALVEYVNEFTTSKGKQMKTTYSPPKLTHYGNVRQLVSSDIKCSPGADLSYHSRWTHPTSEPYTHWQNADGTQRTPAFLFTGNSCQWEEDIVP